MNKTHIEPDRWTPVLRGDTYCSPACGAGCTKAAHDAAQRKAKALARRMGPGFKPRVWENLGWHYSAERGRAADNHRALAHVDPSPSGIYTAFLNTTPQFVFSDRNPLVAYQKCLDGAEAHTKAMRAQLRTLKTTTTAR